MAGADLADATIEDIERMKASGATTTGWLYGKRISKLEYAPEKLAAATFFYENEDTLNTDCLVHAVNYALRHPYFVSREQIVRLMALRLKRTQDEVELRKSEGGVPPSAFVNFCVVGGAALSLELVESFKVEEGQGPNALRSFINAQMIEQNETKELIVVGTA